MNWTKQEQELITVLERFLDDCAHSEKLQNINYHIFLEQILAITKGDIHATKNYCQQILETGYFPQVNNNSPNTTNFTVNHQPQILPSVDRDQQNFRQSRMHYSKKFKSFWTLLFLLIAGNTIFFAAKQSPHLSSVKTVSNLAVLCPASLLETAQLAIKNREESLLKTAIAEFQTIKEQQADQLGTECEKVLWETQFIYAIDFLASKGQQKKAVKNLCEISEQYYQAKNVIPWFTRWSNTNSDFRQWLNNYKAQNNCAIAPYLE